MSRLLTLLLACAALQAGGPKVIRTLKVGGEGGWDYLTLDAASRRLYVPRGSHLQVLDLDGKLLGDLPDTAGVHGVALAPALDRGFTSNGRADTVTLFQLSTLKVLQVVKVTGANPDAILFEPVTARVFTFNGRGQNATALDAATGQVLGTIPLGDKPEFAVADGKGRIFVNLEGTSRLAVLDAATLKEVARWPLAPLEAPTGLAMDAAHRRLFAVGGNRLMAVVDADSGRVLTTLPIGEGADGAAFDPATGLAYSSNGEGSLTVVKEASPSAFTVLAQVPTKRGARTLALDPKTHHLFLPTADVEVQAAPGTKRPAMIEGSFQILEVGE